MNSARFIYISPNQNLGYRPHAGLAYCKPTLIVQKSDSGGFTFDYLY